MKSGLLLAALLHLILSISLAEGFDSSTSEAVQPEDGSTTNIHSPAIVLPDSPILEVQAETGQEENDDAFDVGTINDLKQYANMVRMQLFP